VKRMIRVLAVAVLVAVILVASMSPALARARFGQNLGEDDHPSCKATKNAQNERGAHHVVAPRDPDPHPGSRSKKSDAGWCYPATKGNSRGFWGLGADTDSLCSIGCGEEAFSKSLRHEN
jgi:hypothetical protein